MRAVLEKTYFARLSKTAFIVFFILLSSLTPILLFGQDAHKEILSKSEFCDTFSTFTNETLTFHYDSLSVDGFARGNLFS